MSKYIKHLSDAEAVEEYDRLIHKRKLNKDEDKYFLPLRERVAKIEIKEEDTFIQYQDKLLDLVAGNRKEIKHINPDDFAVNKRDGIMKILNELIRIAGHKQYVVQVGDVHYTLNQDNIQKILDGLVGEVVEVFVESDQAFIEHLYIENELSIYEPHRFERKKFGGAFFPYIIIIPTDELDLTKYGIYDKVEKENYEHNCFFKALKEGGLPIIKLEQLKQLIQGETTSINAIKSICDTLKIKVILKMVTDNKRDRVFGENYNDEYKICLFEDHYFVYDQTEVTSYAIEHYHDICDKHDWNRIIKKCGMKSKKRYINSLDLIRLLIKNKDKLLQSIKNNTELYSTALYDKVKDNSFETLDYPDNSVNLYTKPVPDEILTNDGYHIDRNDNKYRKIVFDFETYNNDKNEIIPYLVCYYDMVSKKTNKFIGPNCAIKFLDSLKEDTFMIAHNAGFDFKLILKHLTILNYINKNNSLMSCTALYFNKVTKQTIKITIHDSYKFIPEALSKFKDIFGLEIGKEVLPYELYTIENINKKWLPITEGLKYVKPKDKETFLENIKKWKLQTKDLFDIVTYSLNYCILDCEVLAKGYEMFRSQMYEVTKLNIDNYCSIASIVDKYLKKQGCYEGVYELSGVPRAFIQLSVVGGRVMSANHKKIIKKNCTISDFDAVSLYPSAMFRMGGFLMGKPKVLKTNQLNINTLQGFDGYFVKVFVKKIGRHRAFPLSSYRDPDNIRIFTNEMVGKYIHINKIALEDAIKFQNIDFEIIEGYYFNEGRNNKIREVIEFLFNERIKQKRLKNPIQVVYKLMMNSAYGRSILKPIIEEIHIFKGKKNFEKFVSRNYNYIKTSENITENQYVVKTIKPIDDHFNFVQVGSEILSMSKRIMNEVMCLAEDNVIDIDYQDTDSMHMEYDKVNVLGDLFKKQYGRDLIGEGMGQFHTDFEIFDDDGNKLKVNDIKSINLIALGKKSYIDELQGTDKDGKLVNGYHIKMKGIPKDSILYQCQQLSKLENKKVTPIELYERLYNGETIEFDLLCGGKKFRVEHTKSLSMNKVTEFKRKIKF